jgi:hypothetical protein
MAQENERLDRITRLQWMKNGVKRVVNEFPDSALSAVSSTG